MSSDKNMRNIVVIGSCCVDFTAYSSRLPKPGETLHGTKFTNSYGGKGANQCVAAAKLGGNTFMICRLGDDQWGRQYKDHLSKIGVDVTYTSITKDTSTGIAQISVADNGENQIVIVAGANDHLSKDDVETAKEVIRNADVLVAQLETPLSTTVEAFKLCNGIKLLNAAPARTDIDEILPLCSILCVNECEASMLAGFDVDLCNAKEALQKLLQSGCETVIITLGHQGAVYGSKHDAEYYHVFCEKVTAVDTTGAGDAFVGALATYLTSHKDNPMHQIIGAACDIATMSVLKQGTQTSYPTDYKPFTKEYIIAQLKEGLLSYIFVIDHLTAIFAPLGATGYNKMLYITKPAKDCVNILRSEIIGQVRVRPAHDGFRTFIEGFKTMAEKERWLQKKSKK